MPSLEGLFRLAGDDPGRARARAEAVENEQTPWQLDDDDLMLDDAEGGNDDGM
jgi:hypothetical protein